MDFNYPVIRFSTLSSTFNVFIPSNVTTRDDGAYECQISTQNKMSQYINLKDLGESTILRLYLRILTVPVPTVTIDGALDI